MNAFHLNRTPMDILFVNSFLSGKDMFSIACVQLHVSTLTLCFNSLRQSDAYMRQ